MENPAPCVASFGASHSGEHPRGFPFTEWFAQPELDVSRNSRGIAVSTEQRVPQAESGAEIGAVMFDRVMHAMVHRRNEKMLQHTDVDVQVGVLPKLDEQADGVGYAGLDRGKMEKQCRNRRLGNVVHQGV